MTLRDRLAALTAPCPSTDELVAYEAGWTLEEDEGWWVPPGKDVSEDDCKLWPPAYTSSLDAVVELVEREMPDLMHLFEEEWSLHTAPGGYWACVGHEYSTQSGALHKLPAVALLLALLDAKGIE